MLQDSNAAPAEQAARDAWDDYVSAATTVRQMAASDDISSAERRQAHERAIDTHRRFEAAYTLLTDPTPPSLEHDRNRLACEGVALVSLLAAFVGLFLPDLIAEFWPLAITFAAVAALGGWTIHFLGRLGQHLGRRM